MYIIAPHVDVCKQSILALVHCAVLHCQSKGFSSPVYITTVTVCDILYVGVGTYSMEQLLSEKKTASIWTDEGQAITKGQMGLQHLKQQHLDPSDTLHLSFHYFVHQPHLCDKTWNTDELSKWLFRIALRGRSSLRKTDRNRKVFILIVQKIKNLTSVQFPELPTFTLVVFIQYVSL